MHLLNEVINPHIRIVPVSLIPVIRVFYNPDDLENIVDSIILNQGTSND
jgi:hypothetical protein